ncbi:MAG TPA: hypothetical protein VM888_12130 [Chitinophagaceae bacterium]|jgi:hypothetical protein|nr:hypothetical protein [Chitinophagaceae bacterium]
MKSLLITCFSFLSFTGFSQSDTVRTIEPGFKTSFENYRLLIIALVGLLLLIGLWFWFKRARKK